MRKPDLADTPYNKKERDRRMKELYEKYNIPWRDEDYSYSPTHYRYT